METTSKKRKIEQSTKDDERERTVLLHWNKLAKTSAFVQYFEKFGPIEYVEINISAGSDNVIRYKNVEDARAVHLKCLHWVDDCKVHARSKLHFVNLNEDCLMGIFELLEIKDLCSVAACCTTFESATESVFESKYAKKHDFESEELRDGRILKTFGHLVKSIRVEEASILINVSQFCSKRLKRLKLSGVCGNELNYEVREKLKLLFTELEDLTFYSSNLPVVEIIPTKLLKLKFLEIAINYSTSDWIRELSPLPNLQELTITNPYFRDEVLRDFCLLAPNIKVLRFEVVRYSETIVLFKHLETLVIKQSETLNEEIVNLKKILLDAKKLTNVKYYFPLILKLNSKTYENLLSLLRKRKIKTKIMLVYRRLETDVDEKTLDANRELIEVKIIEEE